MDELTAARIEALEAKVAHLLSMQSSVGETSTANDEQLLGGVAAEAEPAAIEPMFVDDRTDRRTMLRRAGVAALAAAGASVVAARPVAAADGSSLILGLEGGTNSSSTPTTVNYTGANGTPAYRFHEGTSGTLTVSAALAGSAISSNVAGVYGRAGAGRGVMGVGSGLSPGQGYGVVAAGEKADIWLQPSGSMPPNKTDYHEAGELHADFFGSLWFCVTSGAPGKWRKLSGDETAGSLHLLASPVRAYDSRTGEGTSAPKGRFTGTPIEKTIDLTFGGGVPVGAVGALVNVTVADTVGAGLLSIYSSAVAFPGTSTVNWSTSGDNLSKGAVVAVDSASRVNVRVHGDTHVLVDVSGYYR